MEHLIKINDNYGVVCRLVRGGMYYELIRKKKWYELGNGVSFNGYRYLSTGDIWTDFAEMESMDEEIKRVVEKIVEIFDIHGVTLGHKSNNRHIFENIVKRLTDDFIKEEIK